MLAEVLPPQIAEVAVSPPRWKWYTLSSPRMKFVPRMTQITVRTVVTCASKPICWPLAFRLKAPKSITGRPFRAPATKVGCLASVAWPALAGPPPAPESLQTLTLLVASLVIEAAFEASSHKTGVAAHVGSTTRVKAKTTARNDPERGTSATTRSLGRGQYMGRRGFTP